MKCTHCGRTYFKHEVSNTLYHETAECVDLERKDHEALVRFMLKENGYVTFDQMNKEDQALFEEAVSRCEILWIGAIDYARGGVK